MLNLSRLLIPVAYAQDLVISSNNTNGTVKITQLGLLISALTGTLIIVSALLAFLFLILGGIQWITSGGDKAGMEAARNKITHAIVGLIIVGSAWAIMALVQNFLGVTVIGGAISLPRPYQQ